MLTRIHLGLLRVFRRLPRRLRIAVVHLVSPNFSVGALPVVEQADGRVLLVRHSYRPNWGLPGGLAKRGEAIGAAARREALEEVNLPIVLVGEPTVVVEPHSRRVDVIFRAAPAPDADLDDVRPTSPEVVDVGWFSPQELPELQPESAGALVALARSSRSPQATPLRATPPRRRHGTRAAE